jgi:uncharacterized protein (UPF0276 family)
MKYLELDASTPTRIGLANGPAVRGFHQRHPDLVDYVEIPFEQIRHDAGSASVQETLPAILHCASMSVAGFVPPSEKTLAAVAHEAERMRTPWIGEHLAFISADPLGGSEVDEAPPTSLTYTVCPQLSEQTVQRVAENLAALEARFPVPLLLENPPQYFEVPGSTMPMIEFIGEVFARSRAGLLLDLTHFQITSINMGFDAAEAIVRLPLDRVVEIHISGLTVQSGVAWDDHASAAPDAVLALLGRVLERTRPRAITFEYNWSTSVPDAVLIRQIARVRELLAS